jgi:hypothetical protein
MEANPGESVCPKCGAKVAVDERFCAACGAGITIQGDGTVRAQDPLPSASLLGARIEADRKLGVARKWLLAISILTLASGFVFYAIQKGEIEKQIRDAEAQTSGMDPELRDRLFKEQIGMTWDEAVAHDRGMVTMTLVVNLVLAVLYLGMWIWARTNALAASVTALLLFVTTIGVSAVLEPKTLAQGILVKILFLAALAKAISAGYEERARRRATV